MRFALLLYAAALAIAPAARAQTGEPPPPHSSPMPAPTPLPQDAPYAPGALTLKVDASDIDHRVFRVAETIPVAGPGPLTLLYPQWLPGDHEPDGALDGLSGLVLTANGKRLEWLRDPVDVYAFHLEVPPGVTEVQAQFTFVSPTAANVGRVVVTPEMLNLEWDMVALYPAGFYARQIRVDASLTLPQGWGLGVALERAATAGATTIFKRTRFDTLIDSPVMAGKNFKRIDLDPGAKVPVFVNIVADKPEQLEIKPEQLAAHRNLVTQAYKLFGSRHYDHYDFLFALSDRLGGVGLEHHRSSEDGVDGDYFTEWSKSVIDRDLLPHEFTHSWNGKFRRPADLWTPNYNVPMRDSLLWVYEGQTQYWGYVLAARSGLWSSQDFLDALASTAARQDHQIGRTWKSVQDTTNDPIISQRAAKSWPTWQRSEDYYPEGQLIWLDADTLIRERSGGKRSLDDFARRFFGPYDGSYSELTYGFDDVVAALNAVEPYDWAAFLKTRVNSHGPGAPLDGLARGGYRLVYTDSPSAWSKTAEGDHKLTDLSYSLGLAVNATGGIVSVAWDGPAFRAGLTTGKQVVAVNGTAFSGDELKQAVTHAKGGSAPTELLVKDGDRYLTYRIAWNEGLKYPHLERIGKAAGSLDVIIAPRK